MKFRIKKYKKGFMVQVHKPYLIFLRKWSPLITFYGLREPYFHSTYALAERNLLDTIKWDTVKNSRDFDL